MGPVWGQWCSVGETIDGRCPETSRSAASSSLPGTPYESFLTSASLQPHPEPELPPTLLVGSDFRPDGLRQHLPGQWGWSSREEQRGTEVGPKRHSVRPLSSAMELEILPLLSPRNPCFRGMESPWENGGNGELSTVHCKPSVTPHSFGRWARRTGRESSIPASGSTDWPPLCPSRPELWEALRSPQAGTGPHGVLLSHLLCL